MVVVVAGEVVVVVGALVVVVVVAVVVVGVVVVVVVGGAVHWHGVSHQRVVIFCLPTIAVRVAWLQHMPESDVGVIGTPPDILHCSPARTTAQLHVGALVVVVVVVVGAAVVVVVVVVVVFTTVSVLHHLKLINCAPATIVPEDGLQHWPESCGGDVGAE